MKIGIITVYDSMNYGSFLQAYALQSVLQREGHDVVFIQWNHKGTSPWKAVLKSVVYTKHVSARSVLAGLGRINAFKKEKNKLIVNKKMEDDIDLYVIGSDTLWDVARPYFRNQVFYGSNKAQIPAVSYAVSCSDSTENDFIQYIEYTSRIKTIKQVTVRDKYTQMVIDNSLGVKSELVCDPTLLVEDDFWKIKENMPILSDTVLVYTYGLPDNIVFHLKKFCKEKKLKLVSLCIFQHWCDAHINCSPLEFPAYLKAATNVVTNTFHGTIFSIISESNLVSIRNGRKLESLINEFFVSDISLGGDCDYEEFKKKAETRLDYATCKNNITRARLKSLEILKRIIQ